ncbi:MAG: hypothetical protein OXI55_14135 [Gammaproteobacteria bacterium]|nr:hypothetical protein [Gammaproteobacteria bacterium]
MRSTPGETNIASKTLRRGYLTMLTALAACTPDLPPATEFEVMQALAKEYVLPLGRLPVVSQPSDCRTDGETKASLPADLFAAFLAANTSRAGSFDLARAAPRLLVDASGDSPRRIAARSRSPALLISRAGLLGNQALVCMEIFGTEERSFFLHIERNATGAWSVRSELEAWREDEPLSPDLPPEELPDGTLWTGEGTNSP